MTQPIPENGLHPNIARIAAQYDIYLEQVANQRLTVPAARAKIAQLEARDDQGIRWSIDPDTGQFVRKTALGAEEYDTPPRAGYQTHDAFSYTNPDPHAPRALGHSPRVENPNERLEMFTANMTSSALTTPPEGLSGGTRGPRLHTDSSNSVVARFMGLPAAAKIAAGGAFVAVVAFVAIGLGGPDSAEDTAPTDPVPTKASK